MKLSSTFLLSLLLAFGNVSAQSNQPLAGSAEGFPRRPVTLIVSAGGLVDTLARIIQPALSERWKQPVIVEARAGASGTIGSEFVARAAPDGHTLLLNSAAAFAIVPAIYKNLRFDSASDFTGVVKLGSVGFVLLASPSFNANTMAELQTMVRAAPGKFNYASPGAGTSHHFGMELLKQRMDLKLQHIPYKTVPAALTDIIAGQVQLMLLSTTSAMPYLESGRVKLLAATGADRIPGSPGIATFREQGLAYMDAVESWFGVVAPARTPRAIVDKLNQDIRSVMAQPQVREQLTKMGMVLETSSAADFDALVKSDLIRWSKLAAEMNLQAE